MPRVHSRAEDPASSDPALTSSQYFVEQGSFLDCLCLCCCNVAPSPQQASKVAPTQADATLGSEYWREQWWRKLASPGRAKDRYTLGKKLGKGSYSVVYEAVETKGDGTKWAAKVIAHRGYDEETRLANREAVLREAAMMLDLKHEHLLNLREFFVQDDAVVLILERMRGSTLLDYVLDTGGYSEHDAAVVFRAVLEAIKYMHAKGIVHRDIKLENLMLARHNDPYSVKIADFGFACDLNSQGYFTGMAGTPAYLAPEVVVCIQNRRKDKNARRFTTGVDMWAAGASLFLLLGGYPPFDGSTTADVFDDVMHGHVTFSEPSWEAVSDRAKNLIKNLLQRNPRDRYTAAQALACDWIARPPSDPKTYSRSNSGKEGEGVDGDGGNGYGRGGILEESGRGLARYRRRASSKSKLNLSASRSTMLELQEKHGESHGRGLNESLRRIFGLNKKRVPAAALNKRENRGASPERAMAPTSQNGREGSGHAPGGLTAPATQGMVNDAWVPASPIASPKRIGGVGVVTGSAPRGEPSYYRRAPGWGSGSSSPVRFTPEMQAQMYAQQGAIVGRLGELDAAGAAALAAELESPQGGGGFVTGHLAAGSPVTPDEDRRMPMGSPSRLKPFPAPPGAVNPFAHYAAAHAAAAHAEAFAAEQAQLLARMEPSSRQAYLRAQMQVVANQNAELARQLRVQTNSSQVTVPYGTVPTREPRT